nr:RecName: Full=[Val1,Thr6]-bradykinyl-Val,Asp [Pithecopus hypochondrialis]
VPPGFTPFRVD